MSFSPAVGPVGVLTAARRGAARGAAAGGLYALALGALLALHAVFNSVRHGARIELDGAALVVVVAVLVASVVAVPVGATAGSALGMAFLPLARGFSHRVAGGIAAAIVILGVVATFFAVRSSNRGGWVDEIDELLYFCVLPALMAARGAYQHTSRLPSRSGPAER